MTDRRHHIDMINEPLLKGIVAFSVPLMVTNLLQMVFNAADTIVVGKFAGEIPLAAVGATGSLIFMFTALLQGLATGTNVIVAQKIGARDFEGIKKSVHTSILLALFTGGMISILAFFLAGPLLKLMSTPVNIIDKSLTYMRIYLSSAVFIAEYNFLAGILRAKGDTKRPMYYLMFAGVCNVLLNLLLVIVFKLAVVGVALATVMSQVISAVLCFIALCKDNDEVSFHMEYLSFDKESAFNIIRIGVPASIQSMAFSFTNLFVQSSINSFDSSVVVAGNTAAANVENFIYIGMMAFCQATVTFTSQNMGARKKERILPIFFITMALACASAFLIGVLAWYFSNHLLFLYTDDLEVVKVGMVRMFYVGVFLFLNGMIDVFACSMRGLGKSTLPSFIMVGGIITTRIIWILTVFNKVRTLESLYICFPISWSVTLIIYLFFYIPLIKKYLKLG